MNNLPQSTQDLLTLLAQGKPVSGSQLATQLGITRAAIWKHIQSLRNLGLSIQSRPRLGYWLETPITLLDKDAISSALPADFESPVHLYKCIDSTQNLLLENAQNWPDLSMVLAETQTHARGRRGKTWQAPLGFNLYLSCLKHFDQGFADLAGLSLAMGVAMGRALTQIGAKEIGIKWPNDMVTDTGKLAGILIELKGEYQGPCHAVIGIGLNIKLPASLHAHIDQPAVALNDLVDKPIANRNTLAAQIMTHLVTSLRLFEDQGFNAFEGGFARLDKLYGHELQIKRGQQLLTGTARGVNSQGELLLQTTDGMIDVTSGKILNFPFISA